MSERSATIAQVIRTALERHGSSLRVAMPGEVRAFNAQTQLADVQPLLPDVTGGLLETLPIISAVPVQFPGGGGFAETWPVTIGDPCLLVFADRSLETWISRGGVVAPLDERAHELSDAIAILGIRSRPGALAEFDSLRAVWGNKGPRIAADGTAIHLGVSHSSPGPQLVVRGTQFVSDLSTFVSSVGAGASAASTASAAAGTSIGTAAANLVANPAVATAALTAAAGSLAAVAAGLTAISTAVTTFLASASGWLTDKVRTP
jgi:hypothetical protein